MPGSASISLPSTLSLRHARYSAAISDAGTAGGARAIFVDALFDLGAEMPDQALDRPGRRVAQRADGVAFDLLGDFLQQVDLSHLRPRPSTMRSITRHIQPVPSRHGVHWPQLSCL